MNKYTGGKRIHEEKRYRRKKDIRGTKIQEEKGYMRNTDTI